MPKASTADLLLSLQCLCKAIQLSLLSLLPANVAAVNNSAHVAAIDSSPLGRGLSMFGSMKSSDLMSRLKKAMSPEELQAAFQRR